MGTTNNLFLHEEILLLALRDEEGTIIPGTMYQYAIGGAILAELMLRQRIGVDDSRRKLVRVISDEPTGDPLIDEWLECIATTKRCKPLQQWVSRVATTKDLVGRIASGLCRRGILRADEDTILLIFTKRIYPEVNPEPERALMDRLQMAIFTEAEDIDPRTVVLVSLANTAGLLKFLFDKKQLKSRKSRIDQMVNGELSGKAAKAAIEAMQAAVMVSVIMPMMMSASVGR